MSSNLEAIREEGVFEGGGERDSIGRIVALVWVSSRLSVGRREEGNEGVVRMRRGYFEEWRWRLYARRTAPGR